MSTLRSITEDTCESLSFQGENLEKSLNIMLDDIKAVLGEFEKEKEVRTFTTEQELEESKKCERDNHAISIAFLESVQQRLTSVLGHRTSAQSYRL